MSVPVRVNIGPGYRQDVVDGKTLLGTKYRLAASDPTVYKIPEDKHRNTSSFEKTKYSTISRCKDTVFFVVAVDIFFSWDESGNSSSDRFYIIKEISLPKGNQPNQRVESGANFLIFDSM